MVLPDRLLAFSGGLANRMSVLGPGSLPQQQERDDDRRNEKDDRANDPHCCCSSSLVGQGRNPESVGLSEVVRVHGSFTEGQEG